MSDIYVDTVDQMNCYRSDELMDNDVRPTMIEIATSDTLDNDTKLSHSKILYQFG